jgi:hypothetical protein
METIFENALNNQTTSNGANLDRYESLTGMSFEDYEKSFGNRAAQGWIVL